MHCSSVGSLTIQGEVTSLAGLEDLTESRGQIIIQRTKLSSLSGLQSLKTALRLYIHQNGDLLSLTGLESFTTTNTLSLNANVKLSSISGLQSLRSTVQIHIIGNEKLASLAGLEGVAVEEDVVIRSNPELLSISALQSLHTTGHLEIERNIGLPSLAGLENLAVVRRGLVVSGMDSLTSLAGLDGLTSVGGLVLSSNERLTSLTALGRLAKAWGGIIISTCPSLRSLQGLGALHRISQLSVEETGGPGGLRVLGGPFAPGAVADKIVFDEASWPRCVTPHEREALVSAVGIMQFSAIPSATWQRWQKNSCGWQLFTCTHGRPCSFVLDGSKGAEGVQSLFLSDRNGGCGACSGQRLQSNVAGSGVVDFGHALMGEEGGHRSICNCSSEEVGPVAQLLLRGPRQSGADPTFTVCRRGHNCTLKVDGEALEPTDRVVVMPSCEGDTLKFVNFTASWAEDEENVYFLREPAWYAAIPTRYQVCWRPPCTSNVAGSYACAAPEENRYFTVGEVELHGAYTRNYTRILGQNLSVANLGFGVLDGDRVRLARTCGEEAHDGLEILDVGSSRMVFDFGVLTHDRVRAGRYHLCWCQVHGAVNCSSDRQFLAESGDVVILCPDGQELASSGRCQRCPAGRQQPEPGLNPCSECPAGESSPQGEKCEACPEGTHARAAGSSACVACGAWDFTGAGCSVDPEKVVLLALFLVFVGCFCLTLVQVVGRQLRVIDVSLEEGRTIVTTLGSHGLWNYGSRSFPATLHGTGHPGLDSPSEPFKIQVRDETHFELLTQQGKPIAKRLDTSMGTLGVAFPHDFLHRGWLPFPTAVILPLLLITAVALGGMAAATDAVVATVGASATALVCLVASAAVRWRPRTTPVMRRLLEFKQRLAERLPRSRRRSQKGPERAISVGKLHELFDFFHEFIRDRTAYYLDTNIIKPLTKDSKLSYAEFVGAEEVEWFVSHFWGTPFQHFCMALRKHAETACGDGGDWTEVRYWVCFCSNNQHQISDELGASWKESSFYVTLQSGLCHGTCMVLDDQALPLTRIWCIFELLQTVTLERSHGNFQGLLLCTSTGVLNNGSGSVEVAMALAKKVAEMDLATAQATSAHDEAMIRARVIQEMGSFDALNRVIREEVHDMLLHAQRNSNQRFTEALAHLEST